MPAIAYLESELPALSATFVYEELHALERRGLRIVPITLREPISPAKGQEALAMRTQVLYDRSPPAMAMRALMTIPTFGGAAFKALGWLLGDMLALGPWRANAWKLAYQWLVGAHLADVLRREGCSHLHVHFANAPAQVAMYASAFSGVPFTIMAHANDIFEHGLLLPQKARRAVKLLTISRFNVDFLRSVGVPEERTGLVRCGVTLPTRGDVPEYVPKSSYRIGTLCRLTEKKGIDDLLRAVALLRDAPAVEVHIGGQGPLRQSLESLARELGVSDRVHFNGPIAHEDVGAWMRSLDVFALACKTDANGDMDGIPVVLMEAMSQRVPVVSTWLSGIPELVVHEQTGLLARPGDPASLAAELRRLLGDTTLCKRLAGAAVSHVQTEFGQEKNIDRLLGYIRQSPVAAHP